jgi:hypothetical protein
MNDLFPILLIAFATAGLAAFVRALGFWPTAWLEKKPLGCPVCMSGWSAMAVLLLARADGVVAHWTLTRYPLVWLACVSVSALTFKTLYPPTVDLPLPTHDDEQSS